MTSDCDNIGSSNPYLVGLIVSLILDVSVLGTCFVAVAVCLISHLSVLDAIESGYMFLMSVCIVLAFINVFDINLLYRTYSLPTLLWCDTHI